MGECWISIGNEAGLDEDPTLTTCEDDGPITTDITNVFKSVFKITIVHKHKSERKGKVHSKYNPMAAIKAGSPKSYIVEAGGESSPDLDGGAVVPDAPTPVAVLLGVLVELVV